MKLAVVVGCATYEDPIPSLRFASDDARRVAEALRSTCGLDADSVLLLNEDASTARSRPTYTNVLRTLSQARLKGAPANLETLFFFFSGHGYHSRHDGNQYLLLTDSVAEDLEHTALSVQTVVSRLQEWDPRHLVLLVDACREAVTDSKGLMAEEEVPGVDVNALLPAGNITFSSCTAGQRSYEHQAVGSGIFTAALCEALSDQGRCRTLHELNAYLERRVPELCALHGKPRQDPVARLEPPEVLNLEIVSQNKRNAWRTSLTMGKERRSRRLAAHHGVTLQPVLALDFGTTNTLAALVDGNGEMHVVPALDGRGHVPSVVNFDAEGDYVVGTDALELDLLRPEGTVWYPKRDLGLPTEYTIYDRSLPPEFVSSLILGHVQRNAEELYGQPVRRVLASYPASFSVAQSNALQQSFDLAGLEVEQFVAEPSASGLLDPDIDASPEFIGKNLIIDLGGGTLDVALYECDGGVVEIIATHGDGHLGGLDYDDALMQLLLQQVRELMGTADLPAFVHSQVRREANRAKHVLSARDSCEVFISDPRGEGGQGTDLLLRVDRAAYAQATRPLNLRVLDALMSVMREYWSWDPTTVEDASVIEELRSVDHILLCGQGTRIPSLAAMIGSLVPARLIADYQADAVLRGLAWKVAVRSGLGKDQLLVDAVQQGVGLMVAQHVEEEHSLPKVALDDEANSQVLRLIEKGWRFPIKRSELVRLEDYQPGRVYRVRVVELRSASTRETLPLGVVEWSEGGPELEVTIDIEPDAAMLLTLTDRNSKKSRTIVLNRPSYPNAESILDQRLTGSLDEAIPTAEAAGPS